ncbi:hypothetical protein ACS0TY_005689 [Phlomoides rotata]
MTRRYWNINLDEMLEAGVHFGHGTRKWNPKMAPYISAKRKDIHITNLTKTARFLSEAYDLGLEDGTKNGKTQPSSEKRCACGEKTIISGQLTIETYFDHYFHIQNSAKRRPDSKLFKIKNSGVESLDPLT